MTGRIEHGRAGAFLDVASDYVLAQIFVKTQQLFVGTYRSPASGMDYNIQKSTLCE